jgi:Kef-type K+ transport system membrane component KefB
MADAPHNLVADVMLGGVVLLGAALIAVLLFRRLGLGAVLGYLVAGIAIGPDGLGLIGAPETIMAYSEIGIILLLFLVGLELSPGRLWLLRRDIFLFGPLQVILCGLGMFAVVHFAMPSFSWEAALVLGLPLGFWVIIFPPSIGLLAVRSMSWSGVAASMACQTATPIPLATPFTLPPETAVVLSSLLPAQQ